MRTYVSLLLTMIVGLSMLSCGHNTTKTSRTVSSAPSDIPPILQLLDSLQSNEPYVLCERVLTSEQAVENVCDTTSLSYDRETTPVKAAFFFPEADIQLTPDVELLRTRYNCATVVNHEVHRYELYKRKISTLDFQSDSICVSKQDTLDILAEDVIPIPDYLLHQVLPDAKIYDASKKFLQETARFDGSDDDNSPYSRAFSDIRKTFSTLPMLASDELLDDFTANFWDWYDKKCFVPEIDVIQSDRVKGKTSLSDAHLARFRKIVEGERDIDCRTILALEYSKWDCRGGVNLLGEILESGLYTKYLLEAWITWRASFQMERIGLSSFCVIPNNYYDRMRVKCMNTILRHIQTSPDKYDSCLLENLAMCEILHRQASISGNESLKTLSNLETVMFVHPRVSGRDYLK